MRNSQFHFFYNLHLSLSLALVLPTSQGVAHCRREGCKCFGEPCAGCASSRIFARSLFRLRIITLPSGTLRPMPIEVMRKINGVFDPSSSLGPFKTFSDWWRSLGWAACCIVLKPCLATVTFRGGFLYGIC